MARVRSGFADTLLAQRGTLFPFVPVFFACGIGGYFSLRMEPPPGSLAAAAGAGVMLLALFHRSRSAFAPLLCAAALLALGFALAGSRAQLVAGPVLDSRYYGPVTGRVVALDRSASDAVRVTLDRVWLTGLDPAQTPLRVRLSLHADEPGDAPRPGQTVMTTAHLSPPGGAVEPGGFDFRRHAWFLRIGAVGYTRVPLLIWEDAPQRPTLFGLRMALSTRLQQVLPGASGAFATAIITGDRSAIPQSVLDDLRDTNLAHLLAISGLHMGLVSGFVFASLRLVLLVTPFGLRWPVKKLAAGGALLVAAGYLALSGGNVATERAFVMVAVMLLAVICDRRALSLRSVALAAIIVLVLRPEALLGPGFQMSFAATVALVAVFGGLRDSGTNLPRRRLLRGVVSVILSSAVAGAATAPFAMAHFNQFPSYGLLANLATVPLMGLLIIPAAVVAILLMPFGAERLGLVPMRIGLDWTLHVARVLSDWDGAVRPVVTPEPSVLPLIAVGALLLLLWHGRARFLGLLPILLATALWLGAQRPQILVAEEGALVGVMTPDGRALSRDSGAGFIADVWLENDGQGLTQAAAAALWLAQPPVGVRHIHGKRAAAAFDGCVDSDLVIASAALPVASDRLPCLVIDGTRLAANGSMALARNPDGSYDILTARDVTGLRLWTPGRPDQ